MFKRANKLPQRKDFNLSEDEIAADLKNVSQEEDQRRQLFACIDEKESKNVKLGRMEEFLKSSDTIEITADSLRDLSDELTALEKRLESGIEQVKATLHAPRKF